MNFSILPAVSNEEGERGRVKIDEDLSCNEMLLLKMLRMFPNLMLAKFCKLFCMWENWDEVC